MKKKSKLTGLLLLIVLGPPAIGIGVFCCAASTLAESAPHIIINEIQTAGASSNDEFVELFNPADTSISLDGYKLSKKTKAGGSESALMSATKFSGIIQAHGYFLIAHPDYKDKISGDLSYSSSAYYISNDNTVFLYDENGVLLDKAGFGTASDFETAPASNPESSQSAERTGFIDTDNNASDFSINVFPSPKNSSIVESDEEELQSDDDVVSDESAGESDSNTADSPEKCSAFSEDIKITELFPYPETDGQEFVELKNLGAYCADLSGWKIMDEKANEYIFAPGTVIEPGGFWQAAGNFYMNNTETETIYLLDSGGKEIDRVSYAKAAKKYSFSLEDQEFFWTSVPTPGAENVFDSTENKESDSNGSSGSEVESTEAAGNIYLNEIMPNPQGGSEDEYIEIASGETGMIDLFGWRLKDGSKSKGYHFKEHIVLNSGEYFTIYRSDSKITLNNSNESVNLYNPQGEVVSSATFDKSQKSASFNFDGENWKWSKYLTPGKKNKFDSEPSVKIKRPKKVFKDIFAEFFAKAKDKETKKLKYAWDFGDGKKSYLAKTSHKYLAAGKYNVTLTIGDDSQTVEKNFVLEVKNYPRPDLEILRIVPNPAGNDSDGEIVEIRNNSDKKIDLRSWKIATGTGEKSFNHPISGGLSLGPNETKAITREICKFSLNNKAGKIQLLMPDGKVTDVVEYQEEKIGDDEAYMKINGEWKWIAPNTPEKTDNSEDAKDSEDTQNIEPEEQPSGEIIGVTDENVSYPALTHSGYTPEDKFIFYKIFGLLEYAQKEIDYCPLNNLPADFIALNI